MDDFISKFNSVKQHWSYHILIGFGCSFSNRQGKENSTMISYRRTQAAAYLPLIGSEPVGVYTNKSVTRGQLPHLRSSSQPQSCNRTVL